MNVDSVAKRVIERNPNGKQGRGYPRLDINTQFWRVTKSLKYV